jgi:hypothetical protein
MIEYIVLSKIYATENVELYRLRLLQLPQIGELRPLNRKIASERNMSNEGTDIHCSDADSSPNSVLPVLDQSVRTSNLGTGQYSRVRNRLHSRTLSDFIFDLHFKMQ